MGKRNKLEELAPNVATPVGEFVEEYCVKPVFDGDGVQVTSAIGRDGREYGDPVPMSMPLDGEPPVPLIDMMRLMVERLRAPENDFDIDESEEEANDFELEEDAGEPLTPYEEVFVPKVPPAPPVAALKPEVQVAASSNEAPAGPAPVSSVKPT